MRHGLVKLSFCFLSGLPRKLGFHVKNPGVCSSWLSYVVIQVVFFFFFWKYGLGFYNLGPAVLLLVPIAGSSNSIAFAPVCACKRTRFVSGFKKKKKSYGHTCAGCSG